MLQHGAWRMDVSPAPHPPRALVTRETCRRGDTVMTRVDIFCEFEDNASLANISAGQHTKEMTNGNCKKSVSKS
jgi:hypothetical protein